MKRSRIVAMASSLVAIVVLAVACGEEVSTPPVAPPRAPPARQVSPERQSGDNQSGDQARARLHRTNPLDRVGEAHNRALAQYAERVRRGEVRGNQCEDILDFVTRQSYLPADMHVDGKELRASTARAMSSAGSCGTKGASLYHRTALGGPTDNLSAAAAALLGQIDAAIAGATSSGNLAIALTPIVDAAITLPVLEADVIRASASVALSSYEYWEATLTDAYVEQQTNSILATYGTCFRQYGYAEQAVLSCTGLAATRGELPISFHAPGAVETPLRFVMVVCPKSNLSEVVHQDYVGAVGGAIASMWSGAGILAGAAGGAIGFSVAEMSWQMGKAAWCYGSAAVRGVEAT